MGGRMGMPSCGGCGKSTAFFGEMYGRMSESYHGKPTSWMCHATVGEIDLNDPSPLREYEAMNSYKNKLLIPFYGTYLAIKTIAALIFEKYEWLDDDIRMMPLLRYIKDNDDVKFWFATRHIIALLPVVGTLLNGALDIIAQIGISLREHGDLSAHNVKDLTDSEEEN